jgi:ribosome-binding factor A
MSKRLLRVSELLKRELGGYVSKEFDFPGVLVSIHDVDITPNLKKAHVYVGVIGDQREMEGVIEKLTRHRGAMQAYLGKRVTMKFTPRLEFHADNSVERGVRVLSLLEHIADEEARGGEAGSSD